MKWIYRAAIFASVGLLTTPGFAGSPHFNRHSNRIAPAVRTAKVQPTGYSTSVSSTTLFEQGYASDCGCGSAPSHCGNCAPNRCVCVCPLQAVVGFVDRSLKTLFTLPCCGPCRSPYPRQTIGPLFTYCGPCWSRRRTSCATGCAECGSRIDSGPELLLPTPMEPDAAILPPASAGYRHSGKVKMHIGLAPAKRSTAPVQRAITGRPVARVVYEEPVLLESGVLSKAAPALSKHRVVPVSRTPYRPVPQRRAAQKKSSVRFLDH